MAHGTTVLKPGGGPAKPTHIQVDRLGRLRDQGRRIHCGRCTGLTGIAAIATVGRIFHMVCPDCVEHYEMRTYA